MSRTIIIHINHTSVRFRPTFNGHKIDNPKSLLKPILIKHDPEPNQYLNLLFFDTLEKLQWHLIRHAFIDTWYQYPSKQLPVLEGKINNSEIEKYWSSFLSEVKCKRWGFEPAVYRKKKELLTSEGCHRCSKEQGFSTFAKCVELFNEPLTKFLARVRGWIADTVQDSKMHIYYKDNLSLNQKLDFSRRHVHMHWRKKDDMLVYAICNKNNQSKEQNVYILKFGIIQNNMIYKPTQIPEEHLITYQVKTVYGLGTEPDKKLAENIIIEDFRKKNRKNVKIICCHPVNWLKMQFSSS